MISPSSPTVSLLNRGERYLNKADLTQAINFFEHALALAQQTHNAEAEMFALQRLGNIHLEQGQPALAQAAVEQALAIALDQAENHRFYGSRALNQLTVLNPLQPNPKEPTLPGSLAHSYDLDHFFELAQPVLTQAGQFGRPITLLIIAIDDLKAINHDCGQQIGDHVLQAVMVCLGNNLRKSDILARYGGEELIVLMPNTNKAQGWQGAERLHRVAAQRTFALADGEKSLTISVGVAGWLATPTEVIPNLDALISQAQQALERASQMGGNRTQTIPLPRALPS